MAMTKLQSKDELLQKLDSEVHQALESAIARYPDCEGVVLFENGDLSSSKLGARTAVVVGPSNTFPSIDVCDGKWLNDLPSERQYAVAYWRIERKEDSQATHCWYCDKRLQHYPSRCKHCGEMNED